MDIDIDSIHDREIYTSWCPKHKKLEENYDDGGIEEATGIQYNAVMLHYNYEMIVHELASKLVASISSMAYYGHGINLADMSDM
ncbi:hypothetical protein BLOT_000837 [Blomia tropicalis]|nr:hypothetical protein BLOT_000837 [Blomia tropicalis]